MEKIFFLCLIVVTVTNTQAQTALDFDGVNQYVEIPNVTEFNFSNNSTFTIEAMVKSRNISNPGMIFSKMYHSSPYTGYEIFTNANGTILVYMISVFPGNYILLETDNSVLNDSVFTHVAVSYNGSSDTSGIKIYVNGLLEPFTASENSLSGNIQTNAPVTIGSRNNSCCWLDATIDEVRVWDVVRSTNEINENMNSCLSGAEQGLVAYYSFEDGSGSSTLTDHSMYSNNGTLFNMDSNVVWVEGVQTNVKASVDYMACDSIEVLGTTYRNDTIAVDTIFGGSVAGCDSIVISNISINKSIQLINNITINEGESYVVGSSNYTNSGTFTDSLFTISGCDSIITTNLTINLSTANNSSEMSSKLKVYPNPAGNNVYINLMGSKNTNLNIYESTGKLVDQIYLGDVKSYNLNVSNLNRGIYYLRFINEKGESINQKLKLVE